MKREVARQRALASKRRRMLAEVAYGSALAPTIREVPRPKLDRASGLRAPKAGPTDVVKIPAHLRPAPKSTQPKISAPRAPRSSKTRSTSRRPRPA